MEVKELTWLASHFNAIVGRSISGQRKESEGAAFAIFENVNGEVSDNCFLYYTVQGVNTRYTCQNQSRRIRRLLLTVVNPPRVPSTKSPCPSTTAP